MFLLQKENQHYLVFSNSYFGKEKQLEVSLILYLKILVLFSSVILLVTGFVCQHVDNFVW